ncbi:MAG: hypothetical protein U0X73_17210 [Thermoanaerobaculia bacterium]
MVPLMNLWVPIVVSAVFVFIVSTLAHMVINWHRGDYRALPDEEAAIAVLRKQNLAPGAYIIPFMRSGKEMSNPEMQEKLRLGPSGMITVRPRGPMNLGGFLGLWFGYCLLVSFFAAYLAGHTVAPGTPYLAVFRVVGATTFMAYGLANLVDSIWKGQTWPVTFKHVFDGLLYSLVTAGTFGWLWPH